MSAELTYPASATARDRFVLARRPAREIVDAWHYQQVLVEPEAQPDGESASVAAVFLTGGECPWRCAMCDLWRHTLTVDTPVGAIPAQITAAKLALAGHGRIQQIKLYNAGSFFDPRAVPDCDYDAIAAEVGEFDRVIVESHPSLIGPRVGRLLAALARHAPSSRSARLQVAMGLETAHPAALEALNKRMTLSDFERAAEQLRAWNVEIRVFLLIDPPFVPASDQEAWLIASVRAAQACGATVISLVPTRTGNGTMEALESMGEFMSPDLTTIERRVERVYELTDRTSRLFVDLSDLRTFSTCDVCFNARLDRLRTMNLQQRALPPTACQSCGAGA